MPPLNYDGASLVPDLSQSLRMAMGIADQVQEKRKQEEAAGLTSQIPVQGGTGALMTPENMKRLQRLNQLDPNAARLALSMAQVQDEKALKSIEEESATASAVYQSILSEEDPKARNRLLATTIRTLDEQGKDTSKLRELIGMSPEQQALKARSALIISGDLSSMAAEQMKLMKDQLEVQNKRLDSIRTSQQIEIDRQKEDRAQEEAAAKTKKRETIERKGEQEARRALDIADRLLGQKDVIANVAGPLDALTPTVGPKSIEFEEDLKELESLLTVGNLDRMTGVLSESDIALLREAASGGLSLRSEGRLTRKLENIRSRLAESLGAEGGGNSGGNSSAPEKSGGGIKFLGFE